MASTRRIGAEDSATRIALLDAARDLMLEEGYAAVTSRKLAAKAGLKPQLVHYYFQTMDDLFVALVRRGAEQNLERQAAALASPEPLRALWAISNDVAGATLTMEFSALANHRKAIRSELAAYGEQFRRLQVEALTTILTAAGKPGGDVTPAALAMLMTAVAQVLGMEQSLGMTLGHEELLTLVDNYIAGLEAPRGRNR